MAVQRRPAPPSDVDLEITAELPVLDLAATSEHTIQMHVDDALARTDTLQGPGVSGALELAANLRDVEDRLQRKAERLATLERDLDAARVAERLMRDTADARGIELEQLAADLSVQQQRSGQLQTQLAEHEALLKARDHLLSQAELHRGELELTVQSNSARLHELESERANIHLRAEYLDEKLTARNAEYDALSAEQRGALERLAARDGAYARLQLDYTDSVLRNEGYLEALRNVEGYRQINDGLVAERDEEIHMLQSLIAQLQTDLAQLAERDERIGALQQDTARAAGTLAAQERQIQELAASSEAATLRVTELTEALQSSDRTAQAQSEALRVAVARGDELESQLAGERDKYAALVLQIAAVRSEFADHTVASRAELAAQADAAEQSRVALEARIAGFADAEKKQAQTAAQFEDQQELIGSLQSELTAASERMGRFEEDLRAAEEQINRLESEARHKEARVDELVRSADSLQTRLGDALSSLGEREEQVKRLEAEAHANAAVFGNLQQSIQRLGRDESSAGAKILAEPTAENQARLLIRVDGETEVVHVLGRKTTIGRTPDNDIQIETNYISRHHAVLLSSSRHSILEDLNSTNGVFVNGKRITRQQLAHGDTVTVGKTAFRFSLKALAHT
ncbi:MAG: FHA domain-containing protein [Steroidobacteraceae bacterium]